MSLDVLIGHCRPLILVAATARAFEMPETVVHSQIRMPPSLHQQLASRAREDKTSLNALVVTVLRDEVERREAAGAAPIRAAIPSR
jgi:hypothetical protein